jgi:hypothetical protein
MLTDTLTPHPYATCYPLLQSSLAHLLKESIQHNGLRQPIVLWKDEPRQTTWIVDGRNRYQALLEIQGQVRKDQVTWKEYESDEAVRLAVLDYNENRRQMTTAQKSLVAGRLLKTQMSLSTIKQDHLDHLNHQKSDEIIVVDKDESVTKASEEITDPKSTGLVMKTSKVSKKEAKVRKEVASTLGIGSMTARKGSVIVRRGVDELVDAVEQGQISIEGAYTLTQLTDEDIQEIILQDKKIIREKIREIKNVRDPQKDTPRSNDKDNKISITLSDIDVQTIQSISVQYKDETSDQTHTHQILELTREQKYQIYEILRSWPPVIL